MADNGTKLKFILVVILAWLFALAMLYLVIMKFKYSLH
jgi:hypothetical protein